MKKLLKLLTSFLVMTSLSIAEEVKVFDFTEEELGTLKVRKVRGANKKTEYSVGNNENGNFLKAVANSAASGLGKEIKINLNKSPFLFKYF